MNQIKKTNEHPYTHYTANNYLQIPNYENKIPFSKTPELSLTNKFKTKHSELLINIPKKDIIETTNKLTDPLIDIREIQSAPLSNYKGSRKKRYSSSWDLLSSQEDINTLLEEDSQKMKNLSNNMKNHQLKFRNTSANEYAKIG